MWNIKLFKVSAKAQLKGKMKGLLLSGLVIFVLSLVVFVPFIVMYFSFILDTENPNFIKNLWTFIGIYGAITLVLSFLFVTMSFAYVKDIVSVNKGQIPSLKSFFDNFKCAKKAIGNFWWTYLWEMLWGMIALVPYIIFFVLSTISSEVHGNVIVGTVFLVLAIISYFFALFIIINRALAYLMNTFVLVDDEKAGVKFAMNESKRLTKGWKWKLFVLDLSFIGWKLLSVLTAGILSLWLSPYICLAQYNAYLELKTPQLEEEKKELLDSPDKSEGNV